MHHIVSAAFGFSVLGMAVMASAVTEVSPADQRSWMSSTASTGLSNQIDLHWGDTELVVNGGFESDNWYNGTRSSDYAYAGQYRLQIPAGTGTSQIITVDSNATYIAVGYGHRVWPALPRILVTDYNGADSQQQYLSDFNEPDWGSRTFELTTGAANTTMRIWLDNPSADNRAYFDEISVKPKNLYVYRSDSPFTNTASATLISTLDGLVAEGYTDNVVGDYWYAITSSSLATDVTAIQGSAVPEPAACGLLAISGGMMLLRRRRVSL